MAQKKFRVAIIGAGMIANAGHIPAWKNIGQDIEIVAIADQTEARARLTAEKESIPRVYTDYQKMLDEMAPDIVSICTPNVYHREHSVAALQAGAHAFCEKPVAARYDDALAMFNAAEEAGRRLFVSQTVRFSSRSFAVKEIVDDGRLGEMYYAETFYLRRRGIPSWGQFHMNDHSAAGPLYDIGVHALDKIFWLMGNPRVVAASGVTFTKIGNRDEGLVTSLADSGAPLGVLLPRKYNYREFDVEDMAAGFIRLEHGAVIAFKVSWAANVPENAGGNMILGTEGGLTFDPPVLITNMGRYQTDVSPKVPPDPDIPFYGHWLAAAHFVRVLRGEEEQIVKKEEVLNVMKGLDALYRSAEEGREVRVDQSD